MADLRVSGCLPVVVAVLVTGVSGCAMLEKPTARVTGVNVKGISLTEATMLFDVEVANPYTVVLPMGNVDYALSSGGARFLTGKADAQGTVPAGSTKSFGLPVRISYVELLNAVKEARPGATIPYTADFGLSVNLPALGPYRVPMSKTGELAIPSTSSLLDRLKDMAKDEMLNE